MWTCASKGSALRMFFDGWAPEPSAPMRLVDMSSTCRLVPFRRSAAMRYWQPWWKSGALEHRPKTSADLRCTALVALESFQPDAVSFNSAVAACEEASQWSCALELMGPDQPLGSLWQPLAACETLRISTACAMSACEKAQHWREVLQLHGPVESANVLAWNAYVGCQPWQMVLPSLEDMRRRQALERG